MRYLIFHKHDGQQIAFYTQWYEYENNYNSEIEMIVYDLVKDVFTTDGVNWKQIQFDHL